MIASRIYDLAFRILIIFLPFSTLLSVFFREKLWIPGISFLKELCIIVMLTVLVFEHIWGRLRIIWTRYDLLIALYVFVLVTVTIFTTGLTWLIYGGRYDFAFLVVFFTVLHGYTLLPHPHSYYLRLFLISGGVALFLSMLLKWPLSEDLLLYFGYSGNPSNWQFGSAVPIFHGVEWANVRRFQGIFDGPNTMAAYLLFFMWVVAYYFRYDKKWHFVIGLFLTLLIGCIVYTYSRSALLGLVWWAFVILVLSGKYLYRHYRKQLVTLMILALAGIWVVLLQYGGNIQAIIERWGSSQGHRERMVIGVQRFLAHPLGQWLWSVGPGYRYVENLSGKDRSEIEKRDIENIPESWYIQQFIEGWLLWGILFILLMWVILSWLYRTHVLLVGMFFSILIMNFFLHTFESSLVSLSLFAYIALILAVQRAHTRNA